MSALVYGDLVVDENSPVNPDLHFDTQLMHLYVMTEKKVNNMCIYNFYFYLFVCVFAVFEVIKLK